MPHHRQHHLAQLVRAGLTIGHLVLPTSLGKSKSKIVPVVCSLLGISLASDCDLPTLRNPLSVPSLKAGCRVLSTLHPAFEDGTDRGFLNVGKLQSDAEEIPKRIHTIFKTRRKFEIN
jgi:hypothetical protein